MQEVYKDLRRPLVTLQLVWEEYRAEHPDGYGYTQFCEHYKRAAAGDPGEGRAAPGDPEGGR